jgi:hypothetical protein
MLRFTIEARRFTYSGPYLVPHFMQMMFAIAVAIAVSIGRRAL